MGGKKTESLLCGCFGGKEEVEVEVEESFYCPPP
jgi:hypothetical protein